MEYTDEGKGKTNFPLEPFERKEDELGYIKRKKGAATSEELVLSQNDRYEYTLH